MSDIEKAVTGKPLADYEPFIELITAAMCSGIAFIGDGVKSGEVDPLAPLEPQAQRYAREFIKWRGAFMIDELAPASAEHTSGPASHRPETSEPFLPNVPDGPAPTIPAGSDQGNKSITGPNEPKVMGSIGTERVDPLGEHDGPVDEHADETGPCVVLDCSLPRCAQVRVDAEEPS